MLSLAPFRYRNALAADGGPIEQLTAGPLLVRGRPLVLANARLASRLLQRPSATLYGMADGSGTHANASVARHKAISEALERWAFHATVKSERAAEFAFDLDPSTTGMSAFPGLLRRDGRRASVLEAVERFCLCCWWEGLADARPFQTDWPGVSAAAIDGPFGALAVVVWARTEWGGYVYGHAADESFGAACEHAVVELARHEWVLRSAWLAAMAGMPKKPGNVFERRILFFATNEGHELFQKRLRTRCHGRRLRPELICDSHVPGPWDVYTTVWRFALRPPSSGYLRGDDRYFFL